MPFKNISEILEKWFLNTSKNQNDDSVNLDKLIQHWHDDTLLEPLEDFDNINADDAWQSISEQLEEKSSSKPKVRSIRSIMKYAAIFVIAMGLLFVFKNSLWSNKKILTEKNRIVLTAGNERSILLTNIDKTLYGNNRRPIAKGNSTSLNYYQQEICNGHQKIVHTLKVPNGKNFKIKLSDGTTVFCDAGTLLRYPVHFEDSKTREVYLEGQAFFDVTKKKGAPFIVKTQNMDIKVLGTKFNVSAYLEDTEMTTVLAEGSILALPKQSADSILLRPKEHLNFIKSNQRTTVSTVDTDPYTAWTSGKYIYNQLPFNTILKSLERRYGVKIINKNKVLGDEILTAKFENETIEKVIRAFKEEAGFEYKIKDNVIIIN